MRVCMCVCALGCVHACVIVYAYAFVCVSICVCERVYARMYAHGSHRLQQTLVRLLGCVLVHPPRLHPSTLACALQTRALTGAKRLL